MRKKYRLKAIASGDRHAVIDKIQAVVVASKCFLVDSNLFSDLQMSMYIEIKEHRLLNFYHRLGKVITFLGYELRDMDVHSKETCGVYLNITFQEGGGRLKVKVPKVPG